MKRWLICTALALTPTWAGAASLDVIASFSILGDMAQQVGGDRIVLRTLVGPDADAHIYEPRPADAMALARADVVLTNGLEFEGFMDRLIAASDTDATIVVATDGADTLEDPNGGHYHFIDGKAIFHAGAHDPHAWQSIANAQVYVANIADAFCAADADGCDTYRANANAYTAELTKLDNEVRQMVADLPADHRTGVVPHNAYRYFTKAYGIEFLSPQGISTESEASAADVAGLIRDIRAKNARAIFSENIADNRMIEQIASEADLEVAGVLYSDALSPLDGPAPNYVDLMRHNAQTITQALSAK
ncbi:zinc ABC transporter substrate-binding protein AztC [Paracoccus laeviglucosivorans]|uniref:Zinc/manganese transport system substrate-binding protein n=1 Tax=Paracoccus laeviglucosivorans TaxID=1197861 RepID=A0A521FRL1_9RHOB|nr:zinc ABC transporter substrate-binding protein AztC [Paracoccus laeviglucosivorans]SMO98838.1 zinc/manganese transport system substrate-binding protein [Paracoccus laeviglucosivorans]